MYTKAYSQVDRATSLIYAFLRFYRKIKRGELTRDYERNFDKKMLPMCMSQYQNLFAATRIPKIGCDESLHYENSTHIVVLVAGQYYWFDVFDKEEVEKGDWRSVGILSEYDIEVNLRFILNHFKTSPFAERLPPLGVLTTLNRNHWALLRDELTTNSLNKESLEKVESALFVVCLDDVTPSSPNEVSKVLLHGDGRNRWFDKSLQLIIASNGKSGINMEHSGLDGHTVLRFATDVYLDSIKHYVPRSRSLRLGRLEPQLLHWKISASIITAISNAGEQVDKIIEQVETQVLEFTDYGKDLIISHKLSPDGYVQMGFQLAYFRVFGQITNIYESCSTKRYAFGRTETLRGITKECVAFLHSFTSSSISRGEKLKKLRAAVESHSNLMKDCKEGRGVDRHLFGLKNIALQRIKQQQQLQATGENTAPVAKLPELFEDSSYKTFSESVLSTSNCGGKALILFGFGPVVPRGFGIGYLINSDSIIVNLTSRHRRTNFFMKALEWSFLYMRAVLEDDVNAFNQIARM